MAIDSVAKRHSAMQAFSPASWRVPLPNYEIDAADRATLSWFYGGMFIAAGVIETVIGAMRMTFKAFKPTITWVELQPTIGWIAKKPTITFHEEG